MMHEFLYGYSKGHGRNFEFGGCKNCNLIMRKPVNKELDNGIFKELYNDKVFLDNYIRLQKINFPGFNEDEFREAVHDINNRTDEEKKILQSTYDSQQIVDGVKINAFPAEMYIIGYEVGTLPYSWHLEYAFFSIDGTGFLYSEHFNTQCGKCSHYLEEENICNLKLFPPDPEIQRLCKQFKLKISDLNAHDILNQIINKSEGV